MRTVHEIIRDSGGPSGIEEEAQTRGVKLTLWAVKKWPLNGIPEKHWSMIADLCGATVEEIFNANAALRAEQQGAA